MTTGPNPASPPLSSEPQARLFFAGNRLNMDDMQGIVNLISTTVRRAHEQKK